MAVAPPRRPTGPAARAPPRPRPGSRRRRRARAARRPRPRRRVQQERVVLGAADPTVRADLPLERVDVPGAADRRDEQQVPGVRESGRTTRSARARGPYGSRGSSPSGAWSGCSRRTRPRGPTPTRPRASVSTTTMPTPGRAASPATIPGHRSCKSSSVNRWGTCGNQTRPRFPDPTVTTSGRSAAGAGCFGRPWSGPSTAGPRDGFSTLLTRALSNPQSSPVLLSTPSAAAPP